MTHQTVNPNLKTYSRAMGKQQHADEPATTENKARARAFLLSEKYIPWCSCEPLYANLYSLEHRQKNGFRDSWMGGAVSLKTYSMLPQPVKAEEGKL